MAEHRKRFSLRHGIEAAPEQPIFDDAPPRLRFFALEFLKKNFYDHVARELVARILCTPKLLTLDIHGPRSWGLLRESIEECKWWDLYNLLEGIYVDLEHNASGRPTSFVEEVNAVFGEESIGWRMAANGHLERQLPKIASVEEEAAFRELQAPRFAAALGHMESSRGAYNARPRRDREVCSEAFDALESVAKEEFSLPTGTFGDAIKAARSNGTVSQETLSILEKIYALGNNHFRHGLTEPFALKASEVDFFYLSCVGAILMLVRLA